MKDMYEQYVKETAGFELVKQEYGFAAYSITENICTIEDLYVVPDFRSQDKAAQLADIVVEIAKKQGCNTLMATTPIQSNTATESMKAILKYGFKFIGADNRFLFFGKEI